MVHNHAVITSGQGPVDCGGKWLTAKHLRCCSVKTKETLLFRDVYSAIASVRPDAQLCDSPPKL